MDAWDGGSCATGLLWCYWPDHFQMIEEKLYRTTGMESPFSSYICRMCLFRRIIKSKLILFSIDYDLGIKTVSQLTNTKKTYFIIAFGVALILSIDTAAYYAKILPSVI